MSDQRMREEMVRKQIESRGVRSQPVLKALRAVKREEFIDPKLREFAYADHPLPIGEDQTISQPYIVALMTEAAEVQPGDKVLEIGTGSGYAAAILGEIAEKVFTVERRRSLADTAEQNLSAAGYENVVVRCGDGTKGLPEEAPFDAILVAAGGPEVPGSLKEQLAPGGRIIIPVGTARSQKLVRIRRIDGNRFKEEDLGAVRFVPLIGEEGWPTPENPKQGSDLVQIVRAGAEPFDSIEEADLANWLDRVGDSRLVLMGEATHGTAQFYDMRARLTQELIEKKGFNFVAVEADWPDAHEVDNFVKGRESTISSYQAFTRFPTWMWRNEQVQKFAHWLKDYNESHDSNVGFHGLDLYSLNSSIDMVLRYLEKEHPRVAALAKHRYSCLTPWESDPTAYGYAVLKDRYEKCEPGAVQELLRGLRKRLHGLAQQDPCYLDALQNARSVTNAEKYYRTMYYGGANSWNLRDSHMFETLEILLQAYPDSKAVVWEHNSHVGDARATEMSARGEHNIGQLVRQKYEEEAYLIGFGTHKGRVAAADEWGGPVREKDVKPSHKESYERLCWETGIPKFLLPLRSSDEKLKRMLDKPRLERAIGVIYRPQTELASHYFQAVLPQQFDEYIWFDITDPVTPLGKPSHTPVPDTYPFGL